MALDPGQIDRLLKMIQQTQEEELTCPECLDELDKYVQSILDERPIAGILDRVREHLEACPCCGDQFKLVLDTLNAIEE
jgi:transposase